MKKRIRNAYVRQMEQSDCGVACLASIIKYYGGSASMERLREFSGTSKQGTTMLGLFQACPALNLTGEAFKASTDDLKKTEHPSILHVVVDKRTHHYVVCYGFEENRFIISDPAKGLYTCTAEELDEIWVSKTLLLVKEAPGFEKEQAKKKEKWEWVKKMVSADLNILGISLFLGITISILSLSTAVFSQKLIDDILPNSDKAKLYYGIGLLSFLLVIKTMLSYHRQKFLLMQSREFNSRIIDYFYGVLLHLPKSFFDNRKTGELVARMNDTGRIQSVISFLIGTVMIDVLLVIIAAAFLLSYSVPIGITALACIPVFFVIIFVYNKKVIAGQRNVMAAFARNESNYIDTINGISTIKSSNKERVYSKQTNSFYSVFQQKVFALGKVQISLNLVTELVATFMMVFIIAWSSVMVLGKELKLGEMMAILQMVGLLMPAAGRLAMTNIQLQEAKVAFDRMFEFTGIKPEYNEQADLRKEQLRDFESLSVQNIAFRFPGRQQLLKDVSFSVKKGEIIALLGESGSGKSTTMQILQKFYKAEGGSITVNGIAWDDISTASWRDLIAAVPQEIKIFHGTLLDNICLGDTVKEAGDIIAFCKQYGFDKYFSRLPQSYATILGQEGVNLSGGQQQLVALARALYRRPQLLLLDEATSAMDRNTETFIMDLLLSLKNEMGIIMVTHKVKTAQKCDCIYVIEEGLAKSNGTHEELLATDNLYSLSWSESR